MSEELIKLSGDLLSILSPLIAAGIAALSGALAKWLLNKSKHQAVNTVLQKLNHAVWIVVLEIEETMAKEFRKDSEDGKITEDEKARLKQLAMLKLKKYVSFPEIIRVFGLGKDEAENFVSSKVESTINELKSNGGSSVNP